MLERVANPAAWRSILIRGFLALLLGGVGPCPGALAHAALPFSSIAFYYGENAPIDVLSRFDVAVVEPGHGLKITRQMERHTRWLAYLSVGEVTDERPYFHRIPKKWLIGYNKIWKAQVIDQAAPGWPRFLVTHVARPLWRSGYRGFFLDTMDSYELAARSPRDRKRQQEGLVRVVKALRRAFPRAMIITNRGFELLPKIHAQIDGVAFESLYRGWDEAAGQYREVSASDRKWLIEQAAGAQRYGLPVVAIDYCARGDTRCACDTAKRIRSHGYIPYIGDGHLDTIDLPDCAK